MNLLALVGLVIFVAHTVTQQENSSDISQVHNDLLLESITLLPILPRKNTCINYSLKERYFFLLRRECPDEYDERCFNQIFDDGYPFKYRCHNAFCKSLSVKIKITLYAEEPYADPTYKAISPSMAATLGEVEMMNASTLLNLLSYKDVEKRSWCVISLFYAPDCPFSARLAPSFNAVPYMFHPIKAVAVDATDFSRLNSRYGISGTPTVILWVNGVGVARLDGKTHSNYTFGIIDFMQAWTYLEPIRSAPRIIDGPLVIIGDENEDMWRLLLAVMAISFGAIYLARDAVMESAAYIHTTQFIHSIVANIRKRLTKPSTPIEVEIIEVELNGDETEDSDEDIAQQN